MSHDTDKLIRQLSLVAFLMAERRAITARDVKSNVEGYSEMSDEAFARRFYSDRAELLALGVPLQSQRDEFTGEELYTLRSEQYFLPQLELEDEELAALQTAFYLLEGKFAYAEPEELRAIRVEPARERLVGHLRVPLDVRLHVAGGERAPFRHQEGDQRELTDQLVGVVRHVVELIARRVVSYAATLLRSRCWCDGQ